MLLLIVLFLGGLVSQIPLAALAGVLMVTAVRMVEPHNVRAVLTSTRSDAVVLILTAAATITFDLIVAVEVGVAVAAALVLRNVARNSELQLEQLPAPAEVTDDDEAALLHDHIVVYRLDGALFFGAAQRFLTDLTAVTDVHVVILRLGEVQTSTQPARTRSARSSKNSRTDTSLCCSPASRTATSGSSTLSGRSTGSRTNGICSTISTTQSTTPAATRQPITSTRRSPPTLPAKPRSALRSCDPRTELCGPARSGERTGRATQLEARRTRPKGVSDSPGHIPAGGGGR